MNDSINVRIMNGVIIQENGIIRNASGQFIGRLSDSVDFDSEHIGVSKLTASDAVSTLSSAFRNDPDYAHGWHCNIAMMCYDAMGDDAVAYIEHEDLHRVSNDAASRFMKLCFDVETKG